jgi:hypothetical protein
MTKGMTVIGRGAVLVCSMLVSSRLAALGLVPLGGNGASVRWDAPQFIQADARGNVFLLRGDTFQVYPLSKTHELGEPVRLGASVLAGSLLDAAMSRRGEWVLAVGTELHYFTGAEEKPIPRLEWFPAGVSFVHGDPAVLAIPPRLSRSSEDHDEPPLVLRAVHNSWSVEVREALHGSATDFNNERLHRAALALDTGDGSAFYLARQYAYRIEIRKLGRMRPVAEVHLDEGQPLVSKKPDEDTKRLLAQARAEGTDVSAGEASAFYGKSAILALAERQSDRQLYVLVGAGAAGEHCALDRVDWTARTIERTILNMPCIGRATMAAGRDGLYVAQYNGTKGRYFASWEAVDSADWTRLKQTHFAP